MNDPHVAALIYQVRHHEGVNYSRAVPLELEATAFRVAVKDGEARFEMQKHHASEHDARGLVEPYIGSWEFDACIEHGPGYFKLEFSRSEIIDRSPSEPVTGFTVGAGAASWSFHTSEPRVRLSPHGYPSPPDVAYGYEHPDVRTLVQRYEGYRKGKEQLPSFAYFCVTVLEHSVGPGARPRIKAACRYQVEKEVLDRIGDLCDGKGGMEARKGKAVGTPFTTEERDFLERATISLIRRVAEYYGGARKLRTISLSALDGNDGT